MIGKWPAEKTCTVATILLLFERFDLIALLFGRAEESRKGYKSVQALAEG